MLCLTLFEDRAVRAAVAQTEWPADREWFCFTFFPHGPKSKDLAVQVVSVGGDLAIMIRSALDKGGFNRQWVDIQDGDEVLLRGFVTHATYLGRNGELWRIPSIPYFTRDNAQA